MSPPKLTRIAVAVAVSLVAAACSSAAATPTTTSEAPIQTTPRIPQNYADFRAQPTACGAEAPDPAQSMSFTAPDELGLDPNETITMTFVTSCGDIVAELNPAIAPATVNSMVFLAESGYFDGTASHRVVPQFVIQAGDPEATGRGGPGYSLPDEFPEPGAPFPRGTIAMANAGPGTTGSQFFIVLADLTFPPEFNFTVIGRVVDGLETMDAIEALPRGVNAFGEESTPLQTLYLERVLVDR